MADTAETIAAETGVSPATIKRDGKVLEDVIAARAKANMLSTQNNNAAKQNSAELFPIETREEIAKLAGKRFVTSRALQ